MQFLFLALFILFLWRIPAPYESSAGGRIFFSLSPLLSVTASAAAGAFLPILIPSAILLIATMLMGRFFCGWICPLGTMTDFAGTLRKRIIKDKKEIRPAGLRNLKYVILGTLLVAAFFSRQGAWFFDPVTVAGRFITLNLIPFVSSPSRGYAAAGWVFVCWLAVMLLTLLSRRFWCRSLCPLGGFLALFSRISPFKRIIDKDSCPDNCSSCTNVCRTGAIKKDASYDKHECILCMDCLYRCPGGGTKFSFKLPRTESSGVRDSSKRNFLFLSAGALAAGAAGCGRKLVWSETGGKNKIIRPPGALADREFFAACLRCGNCFGACPTNGLQPDIASGSIESLWTPRLVPEIGECKFECNLCGRACPSGAIEELPLPVKQRTRMGTAQIDRTKCLPWRGEARCLHCRDNCPVPGNAVGIEEKEDYEYTLPRVLPDMCIGCGRCQNVCPVRPKRAITVQPAGVRRSLK